MAARVPAGRRPARRARLRVPPRPTASRQVLRFQTGPNGAGAVRLDHRRRRVARAGARLGPAPRLGDPGLGARAGVVRVRVGPVPVLRRRRRCRRSRGCSSRPRSGSRSRSGSASPRSWRTCAASTSAGARSRRSAARSRSPFPVLAFSVDALDGRWHMPSTDWNANLSWMRSEERDRPVPRALARRSRRAPGRSGGARRRRLRRDQRRSRRRRAPRCRRRRAARARGSVDVVDLLRERRSNRVGALLGPMGVRYLAVPERPDPGLERTDPAPAGAARRARRAARPGPARGPAGPRAVREPRLDPAGRVDRPTAAVPTRRPRIAVGPPIGAPARGTRCVTVSGSPRAASLWSQSYDGAWSASSNGESLPHRRVVRLGERLHAREAPGPVSFSLRRPVAALSRGPDRARARRRRVPAVARERELPRGRCARRVAAERRPS